MVNRKEAGRYPVPLSSLAVYVTAEALANEDSLVDQLGVVRNGICEAVVRYEKRHDQLVLTQQYSLTEQLPVPLSKKIDFEKLAGLANEGCLVSFARLVKKLDGCFRIDDRREGNWTYMVWLGEPKTDMPKLMPYTVYHYFRDEDEAHAYPRLTDYDAVCALMDEPNALRIDDVGLFAGLGTEELRVKTKWNLDDCVVVWDLGAIQRIVDSD